MRKNFALEKFHDETCTILLYLEQSRIQSLEVQFGWGIVSGFQSKFLQQQLQQNRFITQLFFFS